MSPARTGYLGLDVGATNIRAAWRWGDAVAVQEGCPLPGSRPDLVRTVAALAAHAAPHGEGLAGVGVGLPGRAFAHEASWIPNAPFLATATLAAELEAALNAPVFFANDAQLALLGEARFGRARGLSSAALLSLGTGVGGALLVGGRVVRGAHGAAGAFGWLPLARGAATELERGQLELAASGTALARRAARLTPPLGAEEAVEAARSGRADARALLDRLGRDLGLALAAIASTLDPAVVLLSGGLSEAFDVLEASVRAALDHYASPSGRQVPVEVGALGAQAGAIGASVAAQEREEAFVS